MRVIIISAMLFTTPAAGEGAQVIVNADTLIKAAYCLGVHQAWFAEAKEILDSFEVSPKPNSDKKEIEELRHLQKLTKERLESADAKLGTLRVYVAAFLADSSLPSNIRDLLVAAVTSGRQDVDACGKSDVSECTAARNFKDARECLERAGENPVCKKVRSCSEFDVPF